MTKEAVESYLREQNRPYSTNDLVSNLLNAHPKSAVQKALDILVAEGVVKEKVNGKQKAYVINQDTVSCMDEKESAEIDAQLKEKEALLEAKQSEAKSVETKLKQVSNEMSLEEAQNQLKKLKEELESKKSRLEELKESEKENEKGDVVVMSKEAKVEKEKKFETAIKAWKQRKRMCNAIVDAILENYNKSRKVFLEDVGIETDESVGAVMPKF